ncbi:MAG TPA: hypothetical protein VFD25_05580 [Clostridia bacterium]|nr:hypothetical protein [Clostridia bacterium]
MKKGKSLYNAFKKYEVSAESLEDFCNKYHIPFESTQFGKEQRLEWFENAKRELERFGFVLIPAGTTTSGLNATYYGKE